MHIPDGFLSTPVWLATDAAAVGSVAYISAKARLESEESKVPLLGVMGAFVFAAQMINFPVGAGTSGHLVGSALLAYTLGAPSAMVVMTAILALQALIFQDGGILALGANIMNLAVVGVYVAWAPYRLAAGRSRRLAIFAGGFLSVFAASCLALSELFLSGVRMPGAMVAAAMGVFTVTAALEGAITVAVVEALDRIHPGWVRRPEAPPMRALTALALAALLLATVGLLFASAHPDGLERFAERIGIAGQARAWLETPMADYEASFVGGSLAGQVAAGVIGVALILGLCWGLGKLMARRRSA